jgi:PPOX class probable F420-dependent enzyme
MAVEMDEKQAALIQNAYYMWFTTVRDDGQPQPTPVWFVQEGETYIVYSQPDAQKVKNIRDNPQVALSFAPDSEANQYVVIMGEAALDESPGLSAPYIAKYEAGIKDLGMTVESMAASFSTLIRITPTRVRGE